MSSVVAQHAFVGALPRQISAGIFLLGTPHANDLTSNKAKSVLLKLLTASAALFGVVLTHKGLIVLRDVDEAYRSARNQ
jgi:hypothetical protein